MKTLKTIGIALLALIVIGLVAAALMPKHFEYERTTDINASKDVVFGIVNDLKTQDVWGPWQKQDPTIQNTFNEVDSGVGQVSSWTSKKSGDGTQTITESTPPSMVKTHIEFEGQGGSEAWFKLDDAENGGTKTTWAFAFDAPWPWNLMSVMMGGQMDKMLEQGLAGIKEMAEKRAAEAPASTGSYEVKTVDFPSHTYLGIREKTTFDEFMKPNYFADRVGRITTLLEKSKMKPTGGPTGVFYTWDEASKTTDMAVAMAVNNGTAVAGGTLQTFEVPASKALVVDYYGSYDGFASVHQALGEYVKANGLKEVPPIIEEYVTGPSTEKDTSKWLTKIYYFTEGPMAKAN
ncbi:MAG: SRPBCC family protein [Bacteroidetes bacterium]|nr:SRPBCC family protein [Bacteroidota bacterium]